ncbi:MAG: hypothetical protein JSS86_21245, partial [Cyanobacteria bacterium SZAS LIN-2]|nr:hypothetical protein [Cyanobacteria bacterium SZAS LIN-2]
MKLRYARRLDFTGTVGDFDQFESFGQPVIDLLRTEGRSPLVIVIDHGYGFAGDHVQPHIVLDHLNLTGDNPLVGPNNPIGQRFPVVNDIYVGAADIMDQEETWSIGNPLGKLRNGIAAGVKHGLKLNEDELSTCRNLGAHFYCYNLVPTMIVAAHAGLKVLGL